MSVGPLAVTGAGGAGGYFQCIQPGASQKVTFSGTSAQATAFQPKSTVFRIFATQDCYIKLGANPTATASDMFIPGGIVQYFGCNSGDQLAVIQSSAGGTLYVTEAL